MAALPDNSSNISTPVSGGMSSGPMSIAPAVLTSDAADKHINETVKPALAEATAGITTQAANAAATKATQDAQAAETVANQPDAALKAAQLDAIKQKALLIQKQLNEGSTGTTDTTITDTSSPVASQEATITSGEKQLQRAQDQYDAQAKQVHDTILGIQNGSVPLNEGEKAQITGLQQQFQQLIQQQQLANKGASGLANVRGYQSGAAEYDPTFQVKTIGAIVTAGNNKIADLNIKMASAVASLTQSFKDNDIAAVKDAYNVFKDASDRRTKTIQDTVAEAQKEIKDYQDQQQKIQDQVSTVAEELAKNGAPQDVVNAALNSNSQAEAISAGVGYFQDPTSTAGQYQAYVKDAQAKGLTPMTPGDFISNQKAKEAYASAYASESAKANFTGSSANQQKLEQQGRAVIEKELSNRSGGLGLQDAKVNQAVHLKNLFEQYKQTDANGNVTYDIPPAVYTELAIGVASLVSGSNTVAEGTINNIRQATAQGDLGKALTYATGETFTGSSQKILGQLKDSVDRQGATAQELRQTYIDNLAGLLPTDLSDDRRAALLQASHLNDYVNAKDQVNTYVQANPEQADTIAKLYEVPGATDEDVLDYINLNNQ